MPVFIAMLYAVQVISLPGGMAADLSTRAMGTGYLYAPEARQLYNISMSQTGEIAVIIHAPGPNPRAESELLVIRPDGSRAVLKRPNDAILAKAFKQSDLVNGHMAYPGAYFQNVRLARDGTPFATIAFGFSGAYSGIDESVFEWNGDIWSTALPENTPFDTNAALGAADEPWRVAVNVNYTNTFANLDLFADPTYQEFYTFLRNGGHFEKLGYGSSMAMRGGRVVGFSAGLRTLVPSHAPHVRAWEWADGRRFDLGSGIAYGMNAAGSVVGDNELLFDGNGKPVLWADGKMIVLGNRTGSALEIADDGTIVGFIENYGFVIHGNDPKRTLHEIDDELVTPDWHVVAVYGVASSGMLLAVGSRFREPLQLIMLVPS